ncbi:hypothetical protein GCM10023333_02820 [Ferrimonas pelagia]|uniref:Uncharacterized protein n=1 Tax=Ferrimonas pelagia TaxID=1177826 RepID=A0ABP9EDB7_9GAMM
MTIARIQPQQPTDTRSKAFTYLGANPPHLLSLVFGHLKQTAWLALLFWPRGSIHLDGYELGTEAFKHPREVMSITLP